MLRKLAYALGVCIGAVTLGYAAAGGDRFSTELVEVDIGAGYLIPRNYIVNIAPDAEDPELVIMRALWPGLEPLTEENTYLWERRIPERQIHIAILERPRDGYRALQGAIEVGALPETPKPGPFGLSVFQRRLQRMFASADPDHKTPGGEPLVLMCNDALPQTYRNFDAEIICIVQYPMSDASGLYYRFFMDNLENWRDIDTAVRSLVDSFKR